MDRNRVMKEIVDWLVHIVTAIVITIIIIRFVGQFTIVQGNSMYPTLQNNDILIIEKLTQQFGQFKQGDIVVLKIPEQLGDGKTYAVKRIVALEGQTIVIRDGLVYVNDVYLDEPYINGSDTQIAAGLHDDLTVPEGYIYLLGDNRLPGESKDSRHFGIIATDKVAGRVLFRLFPLRLFGPIATAGGQAPYILEPVPGHIN